MKIYCNRTARIKHNKSGRIYEIKSKELDWDQVGGDERSMGTEIHYEAVLDHPDLGELSWGIWEYPIGVENYHETNVASHEVIEDFEYGLYHEEPESVWLDYTVPEKPFEIFMSSYNQTGDMLADNGTDHGGSLINRMIFSHQVTALEAYLGDTLMNEVMTDSQVMQQLIDQDIDLVKEKFTLAEISNDSKLVERKVREHLRLILYHNLSKVDVLYDLALGFKILNLIDDKASLFKAVLLRHDCVHRNGFDKEGNELTIFTRAFVQNTADLIKAFVVNIENALHARATR